MASRDLRIVLIGKTGTGKSSTGNTLLGEDLFVESMDFGSETAKSTKQEAEVNGKDVSVIDTPGFCDTELPDDQLLKKIVDCLNHAAPGPHVFCYVINTGRFTKEDALVVDTALKLFGEDVVKHTLLIITHGDELARKKKTGASMMTDDKAPPKIKEFYEKCGKRVFVITNILEGNAKEKERDRFYKFVDDCQLNPQPYTADPNGFLKAIGKYKEETGKEEPDYTDSFWKRLIPKIAGVLAPILGPGIEKAAKDAVQKGCAIQ